MTFHQMSQMRIENVTEELSDNLMIEKGFIGNFFLGFYILFALAIVHAMYPVRKEIFSQLFPLLLGPQIRLIIRRLKT